MPQHSATEEQTEILAAVTQTKDNIIVNALAGTGKTSTLEMVIPHAPQQPALYLAFNKKIADEATERLPTTTTVRTFNSMGHRVWAKTCGSNLKLDSKKSQTLFREIVDETPKTDQQAIWDSYFAVIDGVSRAKAFGYIPEGKFDSGKRLINRATFMKMLEEDPDDLTMDLIDAVLTRSITSAFKGFIDFNDQIYMPAFFPCMGIPQFPLTLVDEAQDLNPANHALLGKLVTTKGTSRRIIIVGDPYQNIYGFRGAKAHGMSDFQKQYGMTETSLSISFRCPSEIVKHVHWHVPHFKWLKQGGSVEQLTSLDGASIPDGAVILCRNNAPLFKMALHLLAARRSVSVSGSDVGPRIVGIMKKLGDESLSQAGLIYAIDQWESEKLAKNSTTASDLAACMRVFAKFGTTLGQAIAVAEHLFMQKGTIRLMTGHKAKGLEFDNVYHIDPFLCRDTAQDNNIRYVITTRSKDRLTEIASANIQWEHERESAEAL